MPPIENAHLLHKMSTSHAELLTAPDGRIAAVTTMPAAAPVSPAAVAVDMPGAQPKDLSAEITLGLTLYTSSTMFNSGMSLFAKLLGKHGFPVFEIVLTRSLFICGCAAAPVIYTKVSPFGKKRGFLALRGVCSFLSVSALYWSVNLLPLSDALILQFLSPPMVAAASPLLLKEYPPKSVYLAIPICLVAVILIAQPAVLFGSDSEEPSKISALGIFLGIFQAVAASANKLVTRYLKKEDTHVNLLYLGVISTLGAFIMCLIVPNSFKAVSSWGLAGLLTANALCAYLTQLTITSGLKRVPATLGTATSYLTVVWGMGLGYFVFHEVPTLLSLLGAGLICASALMLSFVEGSPNQKPVTASGAVPDGSASRTSGLKSTMHGMWSWVPGLMRKSRGWQPLQDDEHGLELPATRAVAIDDAAART